MRKVLVVGPLYPNAISGGSCLAVWLLQSLVERFEVALATWDALDVDRANRVYGSALRAEQITSLPMRRSVRVAIDRPFGDLRFLLLKKRLLFRRVRAILAEGSIDAVVGVMDEIDVGQRALQYVHYPYGTRHDSPMRPRWFHVAPLVSPYQVFCARLAPVDPDAVARNPTLVNSHWTGREYARRYGRTAQTIYPPVLNDFPAVAFEARHDRFLCLGRIEPSKQLIRVIQIIEAVRGLGHEVELHIVGSIQSPAYFKTIQDLARRHAAWLRVHLDLPREDLKALVGGSRYAIHGKASEHFGIAPAELQRAGCVTFVPAGAGVEEVVGHDERVVYRSKADAVIKIDKVLRDPDHAKRVRDALLDRKDAFSEQRFMREIRQAVEDWMDQA